LQAGVTDVELFDYMNNIIQNLPPSTATSLSTDTTTPAPLSITMDLIFDKNPSNNCNEEIQQRVQSNLLLNSQHQLSQMKIKLEGALKAEVQKLSITSLEEKIFPIPLVTLSQNFDNLLIPKDHYCRRPSDVYYATESVLLRTHLTAYLNEILTSDPALSAYYLAGPVFRRLEEDTVNSELCHQVSLHSFPSSPAHEVVAGVCVHHGQGRGGGLCLC
jgi:phenylalanyl-tRNA synthetase alpha subunit